MIVLAAIHISTLRGRYAVFFSEDVQLHIFTEETAYRPLHVYKEYGCHEPQYITKGLWYIANCHLVRLTDGWREKGRASSCLRNSNFPTSSKLSHGCFYLFIYFYKYSIMPLYVYVFMTIHMYTIIYLYNSILLYRHIIWFYIRAYFYMYAVMVLYIYF